MLLEPFFTLISSESDKIVTKRINDLVFMPLLRDYEFADVKKPPREDETDSEDDSKPKRFDMVELAEIQHRFFDIASAEYVSS